MKKYILISIYLLLYLSVEAQESNVYCSFQYTEGSSSIAVNYGRSEYDVPSDSRILYLYPRNGIVEALNTMGAKGWELIDSKDGVYSLKLNVTEYFYLYCSFQYTEGSSSIAVNYGRSEYDVPSDSRVLYLYPRNGIVEALNTMGAKGWELIYQMDDYYILRIRK